MKLRRQNTSYFFKKIYPQKPSNNIAAWHTPVSLQAQISLRTCISARYPTAILPFLRSFPGFAATLTPRFHHRMLGGMKTVCSFLLGLVLCSSMNTHAENFPAMGPIQRDSGFWLDGYWVWDPSVIKGDDGRYHLFASRWPKDITFHPGWMTNSEVIRAVADAPEGPYEFKEVVLPARGVEYWDGRSTHNPTIRKHGDTYMLFYMGSTHPLGDAPRGERFELTDPRCIAARAGKRIGLATAESLEGPWERFERPILDVRPGTFYSFLVSNPAPVVHADGSVLLVFKARRYEPDGTHGRMVFGVAKAPHYRGPYTVVVGEPIFDIRALGGELEDPFVWQRPDGGYALIAKDMTGNISGERHAGIHALSEDGVEWRLAPQVKAWSREVTFDDGTAEVLGQFERPFILFENGRPAYLFGASGDGPGGFQNMTRTGIHVIPLKSGL